MSLYFTRIENEGQPELVLLHGWGLSSDIWQTFAEALSPCFSLTLIDLPGLGRSMEYPIPYESGAVIDLLLEVAPPSATWLGWSMGGQIAIQLAAKYPDRVEKLITIASNPCFVQRADWPCAMAEETHQKFEYALQQNQAKTLQRFIMLQTQGAEAGRETLKALKVMVKSSEPAAANESLQLLRDDVRGELGALKMPILQLFGEKDLLVPVDVAVECELITGASNKIYQGAGHLPFYSHTDEVVNDILGFVQGAVIQ